MSPYGRRQFLADVGRGALVAAVGHGLASELALAPAFALEEPGELSFGKLEPLVRALQETPVEGLLPFTVGKLRSGTELRDLVAAAALANARTFGGEDYIGFHTMMALAPAWRMALETPGALRALPVLKVLYRNTGRIQAVGGRKSEVLRPVPATTAGAESNAESLRAAIRERDLDAAERVFAALASGAPEEAFDDLLVSVQDATEVHRIVLPFRAWDLLGIIGKEHAHVLLRQSVHYCVRNERSPLPDRYLRSRAILPTLLDRHHLLERSPGKTAVDDAGIERLWRRFFESSADDAAEAAAEALASGTDPGAVGEAIALAANQLVLRDAGRPASQVSPGKPVGSVHGDSIGVHACDSANAWRGMARAGSSRNVFASLILGAYQVALDRGDRGGDFANWKPYPRDEHVAAVEKAAAAGPDALLREAEGAIRENDQGRAAAAIARYGALDAPAPAAFDLLRRYGTSEDGALHAEKFFATASEEFASSRASFRWRWPTALARVTASQFGTRAPGHEEAVRLLEA